MPASRKNSVIRSLLRENSTMSCKTTLLDKFQGCLVGSVIGDCLGVPFDAESPSKKNVYEVTQYFQSLLKNNVVPGPSAGRNYRPAKAHPGHGEYRYTDGTAMTFCVAQSLAENKKYLARDLADRFTEEYFANQELYGEYGNAVRDVFRKLKNSNCKDVYQPAREQFGGRGSYGNGAAMRVSPVALLFMNNLSRLIEVAKCQAQITHSHRTGYNAAVLQCLAVHQALTSDPSVPINAEKFVERLILVMDRLEDGTDGFKPLTFKLMMIKKIFSNPYSDPSPFEIARQLGSDITGQGSVPTAIYCFLRAQRPLGNFEHDCPFVRTLYFAISCGGDTDTLASMSGAIAGARHGITAIPRVLQRQCQGVDISLQLADKLEEVVSSL